MDSLGDMTNGIKVIYNGTVGFPYSGISHTGNSKSNRKSYIKLQVKGVVSYLAKILKFVCLFVRYLFLCVDKYVFKVELYQICRHYYYVRCSSWWLPVPLPGPVRISLVLQIVQRMLMNGIRDQIWRTVMVIHQITYVLQSKTKQASSEKFALNMGWLHQVSTNVYQWRHFANYE